MSFHAALPLAMLAAWTLAAEPAPLPARHPAPPTEHHALHNLHTLTPHLHTGAVPDSDAAFDELAAMGVRTIISVDGASPDVDRALARGVRYVHIPLTYASVSDAQRLEIARAIRDLPGPVYLHCHHGKHRAPAAAAVAAVTLGLVSNEDALAFMRAAGTAPQYAGLYASAQRAAPALPAQLDAAPADFPAVRTPDGLVAAMVEADAALEHLGDIRAAGWTVPADHPDLVPPAEAGRLADQLRYGAMDPAAAARGEAFLALLRASADKATALEEALVADAPKPVLDRLDDAVKSSCRECHAAHRDAAP